MLATPFRIIAPLCALLAIVLATPASAHPHVWVRVETTVVYDQGRIAGLQNRWTFDEAYTTMALEGLDTNGDGAYDRKELAELAQVNIDGLKEFNYFTQAKLGETGLALAPPRDYWLEYKDKILTLHFFLPLNEPVLAGAEGFAFQIFDPSYFIAFDLAEEDPVKLAAGAPSNCHVDIGVPAADQSQADKLGEAFFQEFGGDIGITMAKTVKVNCPG